jgi:hypothetical protein
MVSFEDTQHGSLDSSFDIASKTLTVTMIFENSFFDKKRCLYIQSKYKNFDTFFLGDLPDNPPISSSKIYGLDETTANENSGWLFSIDLRARGVSQDSTHFDDQEVALIFGELSEDKLSWRSDLSWQARDIIIESRKLFLEILDEIMLDNLSPTLKFGKTGIEYACYSKQKQIS